jgi:two-component system response regulator VicR
MERVLIVDDERPIADILTFHLEREGFAVETAYDGEEAVAKFKAGTFHLVVLDIMLPKLDGFGVCREIRKQSHVPILMLTAKEAEVDKVLGLELGADDYITKPFSPRELIARVKAVLRRFRFAESAPAQTEADVIRVGDLLIDLAGYTVTRGGVVLDLTPREFDLMKYLADHPGQVFSREQLLREVWGYDYLGDIRTVDVTVRRLREKVEENPAQPTFIRTRRGVGYYFQRP